MIRTAYFQTPVSTVHSLLHPSDIWKVLLTLQMWFIMYGCLTQPFCQLCVK